MSLLTYSRRGKLTDSMLSKAVLSPIASGYAPPADLIDHLGLEADLPHIVDLFRRHGGMAASGEPKYLAFYRAIKAQFKDNFAWQQITSDGKPQVVFEKPFVNFVRPTLLTLITCCVRKNLAMTPPLMTRYPSLRDLPQALVADLGHLFQKQSFHLSGNDYIAAVAGVLLKGLIGEEVTLVSPVCPDYGYVAVKSGYRYTFDGLGSGVGLVASRVVGVLPPLQDLLSRHGIRSRLVVAAGDFEGFDPSTLARVGETKTTFRHKLDHSQAAILRAPHRPAESVFIADLAGGEQAWQALVDESHAALLNESFSALLPSHVNLDAILDARMPLYQAWHQGRDREQLRQVLLHQCAEYAAMGRLFSTHWPHALVVGGDHNRMMPFYWLHQPVPVLYLKRVY